MAAASAAGAGAAADGMVQLGPGPTDGISSVAFAPYSDKSIVAVASWDCNVYMYETPSGGVVSKMETPTPVLDVAYEADGARAAAATLDGVLAVADVSTSAARPVCSMLAPSAGDALCAVEYAEEVGAFVTGSWDGSVSLWDPRVGVRTATVGGPGKVFALAVSGTRAVVATAGRHVYIYDVRSLGDPEQRRESSLKHQTRAVAANPTGSGYALSSIEGRVAVEVFDTDPAAQANKFAFKCHRSKADPNTGTPAVAYPVNALAYHPRFGTLATGGCDGVVNVWDPQYKRKLSTFGPYATSISSLAFSPDAASLAIAVSYTFETGERDAPQDAVFIRPVTDAEFKSRGPKKRKK